MPCEAFCLLGQNFLPILSQFSHALSRWRSTPTLFPRHLVRNWFKILQYSDANGLCVPALQIWTSVQANWKGEELTAFMALNPQYDTANPSLLGSVVKEICQKSSYWLDLCVTLVSRTNTRNDPTSHICSSIYLMHLPVCVSAAQSPNISVRCRRSRQIVFQCSK